MWYVWFYIIVYQNGSNEETGYLRSNSDEASTVAQQLYDYLNEGYKIRSLQFDGKIIDVAQPPPHSSRSPHERPDGSWRFSAGTKPEMEGNSDDDWRPS